MKKPLFQRHGSRLSLIAALFVLSICRPAPAALLVFDRIVEEDPPYYTDIAIDTSGNLYLSGFVTVDTIPRALVTKRSPDGASEIWSLQFGAGSGQIASGIDVDAQGNVYATGWTSDPGFPLKNPVQSSYGGGEADVFILKINPAGTSLVYSTFLGGADKDFANQIRVDADGNVHVTGTTFSQNFPAPGSTRAGDMDAFVVKLNPAGSEFLYGRLIGGSDTDLGNGLALDAQGRACLTGSTRSTDFPVKNPLQAENKGGLDAFVAILDLSGSTEYATYLGGTASESGTGIAVDPSGNLLLTGLTLSGDFPVEHAFQAELKNADCSGGQACGDGFVSKIDADGSTLAFSTYIGGNNEENSTAITSSIGLSFYGIDVDADGFVYVTGTTASLDFPVIGGLQMERRLGNSDPFLAKFQPDGAPVYSTHVAPGQFHPGEFRLNIGSSLVVDAKGNAYLAGASLPPSAGPGSDSGPAGYIAKVFDLPVLPTAAILPDAESAAGLLHITDVRRQADASTQLDFEVPAGSGYTVEGSTDLKEWTPVFTEPPPDGSGGGGGGGKQ